MDSSWHNKFDLVYECQNIQVLPLSVRSEVINNIANLVAENGILLVVDRLRDTDEAFERPICALSIQEFNLLTELGLEEKKLATFFEVENQKLTTLRIEYHK